METVRTGLFRRLIGFGNAQSRTVTDRPQLSISPYLSSYRIPEGHYALFRQELRDLHADLTGAVASKVPFCKQSSRGIMLHGDYGTGKTEFVHNFASRLADSGHPVNLFCITEDYFAGEPLAAIRALFSDAEAYAKSTGMRSLILWENPEVVMAHKFTVTRMDYNTHSTSKSSTSITDRTVSPGGETAIQMTSMLEKILAGGASPLEHTFLFCTTNHLDAIDKALLRQGRLRKFEFPHIFSGNKFGIDYLSIPDMIPLILSQLKRLAEYYPEMDVNLVENSLNEIHSSLSGLAAEFDGMPYTENQYYKLDHFYRFLDPHGYCFRLKNNITPSNVYIIVSYLLSKVPVEVRSGWTAEHSKALINLVYELCNPVENDKLFIFLRNDKMIEAAALLGLSYENILEDISKTQKF